MCLVAFLPRPGASVVVSAGVRGVLGWLGWGLLGWVFPAVFGWFSLCLLFLVFFSLALRWLFSLDTKTCGSTGALTKRYSAKGSISAAASEAPLLTCLLLVWLLPLNINFLYRGRNISSELFHFLLLQHLQYKKPVSSE